MIADDHQLMRETVRKYWRWICAANGFCHVLHWVLWIWYCGHLVEWSQTVLNLSPRPPGRPCITCLNSISDNLISFDMGLHVLYYQNCDGNCGLVKWPESSSCNNVIMYLVAKSMAVGWPQRFHILWDHSVEWTAVCMTISSLWTRSGDSLLDSLSILSWHWMAYNVLMCR